MSNPELVLHYASGSVPSMSVMIALEEKGIEYVKKEVDPDDIGNEAKILNPREEIPILQHGDVLLTEYLAACMYLEETFGGNKLVPDDDLKSEALVLQRTFSAQNIGVGQTSICAYWGEEEEEEKEKDSPEDGDEDDDDDDVDPEEEEDKERLAEELMVWEETLDEEGNAYIAGPDFTMADVAFFPVLGYLVWAGFQPKKIYPNLYKYYRALRERPSIQAVWPAEWNKPSPDKYFIDLDVYFKEDDKY